MAGLISIPSNVRLCCPRCRSEIQPVANATVERAYICLDESCEFAQVGFPQIDGVPVLVDFERSILSRDQVLASSGGSYKDRKGGLARRIQTFLLRAEGPTPANARRFIDAAKSLSEKPTILVIGGGAVGAGADALYESRDISLVGSDVYRSKYTMIIADGHHLPVASASIQGVWIQAVLEHVLDPWLVVSEIHRVLCPNGLVYAETPFMQQVHEGAFDFTRFSLSGHRWLFREFEEVESGITRGPGTVMLWSIRYLVGSLFKTNKMGTLAAMMFFWLRYLDKFADPKHAADGPSGVYFLGRKSANALNPKDMIRYYKGAQR